jgi:diketogulonate reductase-like aldo/keto reductase
VDISKIALHFTLRNERIATTLISSTSVSRMASNLAAVRDTLTPKEEEALTHLREQVFVPAGTQSWEGVEIGTYWQTIGKALLLERLYAPAEKKRHGP